MTMSNYKLAAKPQSGAALIVSLIILVVLTLIGVTSMSSTIMEEKMAGGVRSQNMAFQAAEAALRSGENWLGVQNPVPNAVAVCAASPCDVVVLDSLGVLTTQTETWWNTNAREYGVVNNQEVEGVAADPRFIVEERTFQSTGGLDVGIKPPQGRLYFRLTARSVGGVSTETILQSHFMTITN